MNSPIAPRLQFILAKAEALPRSDHDALAELVESFMRSHAAADLFTPEEPDVLERLAAEPVVPADPAAVSTLFAGLPRP